MTEYFDATHAALHDLALHPDHGSYEVLQALQAIEGKLAFDCTVCAMLPDFPPDLKLEVHKAILKSGVNSLPVNMLERDFETVDDHFRFINQLCWDLHSVFHVLVRREIVNFSDSPLQPLRVLNAQGDEEREILVLTMEKEKKS